MRFTVERIYQDIAVLEKEDMTHIEVSTALLPEGVKEGNVLVFNGADYITDIDAEAEARTEIIKKQRSIFKKH